MRMQELSFRGRPVVRTTIAVTAAIVLVLAARAAAAGELIPSVGMTKAVDGGTSAKSSIGLALRSDILPALKSEIAVGYRNDERYDGQLNVRSWPVTASLYLAPVPVLYGGAGVGWYQTSFDYKTNTPLLQDETKQLFGVHVGGGMQVPMGPAALDLNGRYVMLQDQQSKLVPEEFNPDFWTMALGLAFKF